MEGSPCLPGTVQITKRFELTAAGADFVPIVERVLEDLQAGMDEVMASAQLRKGTLGVGATPLLMATLVADLLGKFHAAHPAVDIRLEDASTADLVRLLRNRRIEIALGTFVEQADDLSITPLYDVPLVALAHASLGLPARCSWRRIMELPQIALVSGSSTSVIIENTVRKAAGQAFQPVTQAHHWSTVVSLTEALRAVCVVPAYAVSLARGRPLDTIALVDPSVLRTIAVACLKKREVSPAGKAFLSLLAENKPVDRNEAEPR